MSANNQEWLQEYASLKQVLLQKRRAGMAASPDELSFFGRSAGGLDAKLRILAAAPQTHGLVGSEVARRQVLVENLKKQIGQLQPPDKQPSSDGKDCNASGKAEGYSQRRVDNDDDGEDTVDFSNGSGSSCGSSAGAFGGSAHTVYSPVATSDAGLAARIMEMSGLQESVLGEIGAGVGRLHDMAGAMRDEVSMHDTLLDHMEGSVDMATLSLQSEARRAAEIKERTLSFRMYVCLFIEVAVIVLLLMML